MNDRYQPPWDTPFQHQQHLHVNVPYYPRTNHTLHLILTLATCGLWAPVWIAVAIANSAQRRR